MQTMTIEHLRIQGVLLAGTLAVAVCARADSCYELRWGAHGEREYLPASSDLQSPQQGFQAYDNFRQVTDLYGRYRMDGHEVADDLSMTTSGPALVTDLAWSIANTSNTQTLQRVTYTLRLYDEHRTIRFQFSDFITIPIPHNSGIGIFTDSNVFAGFGAIITPHSFMSIQFADAVGVDTAEVGCTLVGPRSIGYSTQFAYNFTTGATIDFDGSDQTNMMFFVDTAEAPSPAVISLLAAAASVHAARRRRCSP